MVATTTFATPTAAVVYDNTLGSRPAVVRLANNTGGDVRLGGAAGAMTGSTGFPWLATHGLVQQVTVPAGDTLAICAAATQSISLLYGTSS